MSSRKRREEPDRELAEVQNVDVPIAVEIEGGEEAGLTGIQVEDGRKQPEIGDVHVAVGSGFWLGTGRKRCKQEQTTVDRGGQMKRAASGIAYYVSKSPSLSVPVNVKR
jgi:hypothetical protein